MRKGFGLIGRDIELDRFQMLRSATGPVYQGVLSDRVVMLSPLKPEIGIGVKFVDADAECAKAL